MKGVVKIKRGFLKIGKMICILCIPFLFFYLYKTFERLRYMPFGYGEKVKNSVGGIEKTGKIYRYYYRFKSENKFKNNENYKRVDNETEYIKEKIDFLYQKHPELLEGDVTFDKEMVYAADFYFIEEKSEWEYHLYYYDVSESSLYYIACD